MKYYSFIVLTLVFVLGFISSTVLNGVGIASAGLVGGVERQSPSDHISQEQIKVYTDRIEIDVQNAHWATFLDSNSMDPFLDTGANALQLQPSSPDQINEGDIISYTKGDDSPRIIHRVVYKGTDEQGVYFIVKGDNNPTSDPGKVRFDQVERVLFAIIY